MGDFLQTIRIACKAAFSLELKDLQELQGDLKSLSKKNYAKLKREILSEGFSAPFFIWQDSHQNYILDGHQRIRVLRQLEQEGYEIPALPVVPVEAIDLDDAKRKLLAFASQYGEMNSEGLYEFMSKSSIEFDEMDSRYRFPEIKNEDFKDEFFEEPEQQGQDDVPEVPEVSKVKLGDLYWLDGHRLLCGDATSMEDVERLMDGEIADMVYTDPPYGIDEKTDRTFRTGKAKGNSFKKIIGDDSIETALKAFELIDASIICYWGGNYFAHKLPPSACWIIWDKRVEENQRDMNSDCEMAWVKHPAKKSVRIFRHLWKGMIKQSESGQSRIHPTQKPVALAEWCFAELNSEGKTVLDLFLGSGSTLIACEKTNRKCFGLEIDPHYCSVILERWMKFSGKEAYRQESDGSLTSWKDIKNGE